MGLDIIVAKLVKSCGGTVAAPGEESDRPSGGWCDGINFLGRPTCRQLTSEPEYIRIDEHGGWHSRCRANKGHEGIDS